MGEKQIRNNKVFAEGVMEERKGKNYNNGQVVFGEEREEIKVNTGRLLYIWTG